MDEPAIVFKHYRYPLSKGTWPQNKLFHYRRGWSDWEPTPRGGMTECYVKRGDEVVATGVAVCSKKDAFSYRIGRAISRGRALKSLG